MNVHKHRWEAYALQQGKEMHWCMDCGALMIKAPPPPGMMVEQVKQPMYQLPTKRRSEGYTPPPIAEALT